MSNPFPSAPPLLLPHLPLSLTPRLPPPAPQHLDPNQEGLVLGTAWLVSDNVIWHLMNEHFPELCAKMNVVGIDTLHNFDETHELATEMQERDAQKAHIYKPINCDTTADFDRVQGDNCWDLHHADFDYASKVEPLVRAMDDLGRQVLITGRRMDQGNARVEMDVYEADKQVFNPIVDWSWQDITDFVDWKGVPYNKKHDIVLRATESIPATERHLDALNGKSTLPWSAVDLNKPYWQASEAEINGDAAETYVWKSFGDFHTSVPVLPHESERAGRFVLLPNSECGIHTRAAVRGQPHGGKLKDLMVEGAEAESVLAKCAGVTPFTMNERQTCDVELLMNGGFSPLGGFMTEEEYDGVVENMRLPEQQLFSMPVTLDTDRDDLVVGTHVPLQYTAHDGTLQTVAVMEIESSWIPNKPVEAKNVFGTTGLDHPGVEVLACRKGGRYIGGRVYGLEGVKREIPMETPRQVREKLPADQPVIAFQCRNPIHRAHYELLARAQSQLQEIDGNDDKAVVLVHPTCGPTQDDDIDALVRYHTYLALKDEIKEEEGAGEFVWAMLPYSMHMAGPREAIMHMIIRKNFGATHFVIGRDMAGSKSSIDGEDFYGAFDAQEIGNKYAAELNVGVVPFEMMVFAEGHGYMTMDDAAEKGLEIKKLSGTKFRKMLRAGEDIPEWFAFRSVVKVLQDAQ